MFGYRGRNEGSCTQLETSLRKQLCLPVSLPVCLTLKNKVTHVYASVYSSVFLTLTHTFPQSLCPLRQQCPTRMLCKGLTKGLSSTWWGASVCVRTSIFPSTSSCLPISFFKQRIWCKGLTMGVRSTWRGPSVCMNVSLSRSLSLSLSLSQLYLSILSVNFYLSLSLSHKNIKYLSIIFLPMSVRPSVRLIASHSCTFPKSLPFFLSVHFGVIASHLMQGTVRTSLWPFQEMICFQLMSFTY